MQQLGATYLPIQRFADLGLGEHRANFVPWAIYSPFVTESAINPRANAIKPTYAEQVDKPQAEGTIAATQEGAVAFPRFNGAIATD